MVLDKEIKTQLAQYLNLLESDIVLQTDLGDDDNSRKVKEFLDEIAEKILNMDPEVDSKFDPECDLEFNSDFGSGLGKR